MRKSLVELECFHCHKKFERRRADHNKSMRLGARNFCSPRCSICHTNAERQNHDGRISEHCGNRRDDLTPFRWFLKSVSYRHKHCGKDTDIDLDYLKGLWDIQNGICPLTGWTMMLPRSSAGWRDGDRTRRASLDRIDSERGYTKGNVRFVVEMANYAKNSYSTIQLIEFCKAVAARN